MKLTPKERAEGLRKYNIAEKLSIGRLMQILIWNLALPHKIDHLIKCLNKGMTFEASYRKAAKWKG